MSHFSVLVIGDDPENQLRPFDEALETECEPQWASDADLANMRKRHGDLSLETLLPHCEEYFGHKCFIEDGTIYYYIHYNPDARWDWHVLGGRWQGKLRLKPGCSGEIGPYGWYDDEPAIPKGFVDQARYCDIDWQHKTTREFVPFAVLKHGEWHELSPVGWFGFAVRKDDAQWEREFQALLKDVSGETLISVYDCHI